MKGFLSFRAKLILTVFPVVAGVTTAALWVAERKFSQSYEHLFQQQFDGQIALLVESREKRSDALASALEKIAMLPQVVSGMRTQDVQEIQQVLRPQVEKLLRERVMQDSLGAQGRAGRGTGFSQAGGGSPVGRGSFGFGKNDEAGRPREPVEARGAGVQVSRPESGRGSTPPKGGEGPKSPQRQNSFVALINSDGVFIKGQRELSLLPLMLDESESDGAESDWMKRVSNRLPWLGDRPFEEVLRGLEVGYFAIEVGTSGNQQIREVFITPVRDAENGDFLGALLVGIPMPAAGERLLFERTKMGDMGEIRSGIWVEGHLLSSTIPLRYESVIDQYVMELEANGVADVSQTSLEIDGRQYRVIGRLLNPDSPFPKAAQVSLYPLHALNQEIGDLRRAIAGLGVLALALALGLVLFVSRGLSGPVQKLVSGVEEIERGNFSVRVPVNSKDEVGRLASAFNDMAAGLALQEKYRSVLNAVADRTVAQQLIENQHALGGELRDVTMLFCDIRGFTALTENMSPSEVIDLLNHHMTALTDVAYRHGGIVDKFVGDLIMVLFGAPLSGGEDASCAVSCALDMQRVRRELNASVAQPLEMGIGIATGDVVAGCMGSDQRLSYTVVGARVNLASRLCGVAQAGEVVLDDRTWDMVSNRFSADPMPPVSLKGFTAPVQCYRLTSEVEIAATGA